MRNIRKWKQYTTKCIPLFHIWFCRNSKWWLLVWDLQKWYTATGSYKVESKRIGKNRTCHCIVWTPNRADEFLWLHSERFQMYQWECAQCHGSNLTHDIGKAILNIQAISYYRRETINKQIYEESPNSMILIVLKNFSSGHFFLPWPFPWTFSWPVGYLN